MPGQNPTNSSGSLGRRQYAANEESELLDEALRLYIRKIKHEEKESRSWIRQPNNLISVVAIVLSLASLGYGFRKDYRDGIDKSLQSLSTVVADLTKLDSDMLTTMQTDPQRLNALGLAFNNRRIALLAEADRLIDILGADAPFAQLAALGPEYMQVSEYKTAIKYFSLTATQATSPTMRAQALRSMAVSYEYMGKDYDANIRDMFAQAAQVFPDPKDFGSIVLVVTIYQQWAEFEVRRAAFTNALSRFASARHFATELPCPSPRSEFLGNLDREIAQAVAAYRAADPSRAVGGEIPTTTGACS